MILNKKNLKIYPAMIVLTALLSGCHTDNDSSSSSELPVSASIYATTPISVGNTGHLSISLNYNNMLSFPIGTTNDSRQVTITDTVKDGNCHILLPYSPMSIGELNVDGSTHTIKLFAGEQACKNLLSFTIAGSNENPQYEISTVGSATANIELEGLSGNIVTGSDKGTEFKIHFSKSDPWQVLDAQKYTVKTDANNVTFSNGGACTLDQENDTCDIKATILENQNVGQYKLLITKENETTVDPSSDNIEYYVYGNEWGSITASFSSTCGISKGNDINKVYCWGDNQYGQLGNGTNTDSSVPVAVTDSGALDFKQISTGSSSTCGIAADNKTYCWGRNDAGQLGNGTNTDSNVNVPVEVTDSGARDFKQIVATGHAFVCGITADNKTYCWGRNNYGQLGDGTEINRNVPVEVTDSEDLDFKQISTGSSSTCGIAADNKTYCWGYNRYGELGDGTEINRNVPVEVTDSGARDFKQISTGYSYHRCGIAVDHKTYCWGKNQYGQLGDGSKTDRNVPVEVTDSEDLDFKQVSVASNATCGIAADNKTYCWGRNQYGQLGNRTNTDSSVPVEVTDSEARDFKQISTGSGSMCGIAADHKTYCWGRNDYGQLGDGTKIDSSVPIIITHYS
jgi:alpha-tubulin suppressor-like RCC1 family protein